VSTRRDRDPVSSLAASEPEGHGNDPPAGDGANRASQATLAEVPGGANAYMLDRLLVLSTELPITEGEERTLRVLVDGLTQIIPDCLVGARMSGDQGSERKVLRSEPPSGEQPIFSPTAGRMFPQSLHERAVTFVTLPGESAPGTLHIAGGDPAIDDDGSPLAHLLQRAALVAGEGLRRARMLEQASVAQNELRALRSHMVQAEKLASLGQIAAGMVHELNNPLTSIVAYTDYLLRRTQGRPDADPDDAERLRRIAESANRMLRFTRDLVSYARPSSDIPVPVPLHAVINRALAFCEHELEQANALVVCELAPDVESVRGSPEQLAQIFVNLVTNACHAMQPAGDVRPDAPKGKLTITTGLVDGATRVRVVVEDSGHGVASAHLPLIFAPFFTTKGAGRGTGLGLSIVKNIVENHNGEIRVESDPPRGTRFILILPVEPR
jgi:two-component system NtrC family sensor kinase